ncbi:Protein 21.1 [Giardia lamblia P15]|uniref:Protein 21.1 n=1 Tax=Giardia intestinalis (strain P15) TaxID=658858 RepID=E1F565_GIAIA|nr:Protein 21.1 [Giardia lamblia P15]
MPQVLSAQDWFLAVDSKNYAGIREGLRRFAGIRDELGDTALMHAARSGDLTAVKILVDHESSLLNSVQQTALIQAILQEQVNVVRFLRPYESHINTSDNRTPFMVAASAGCSQSLAVLTHYFDLSTNPNGLTALDYAVLGNNLGCTKIIIETQDVTLDQVDYALQLSESQHNRELCMYLSSVKQYIKQKHQGRGVSGRKQLFCIPTNELQEMGTVLDKVVRTRIESARRPSSAKASLSVHVPRSKTLDSSADPPQSALSAPQAARNPSKIRFPVVGSSLVHGKSGSVAKFLPSVVPSSAVNSFLQTQTQTQLTGSGVSTSLLSSSSGGKRSSRPSSARAASRPGSAQKSHSVHKKTKEHRESNSRHKHDNTHSKDYRESDAMMLITSLNKELSIKTYENLQLEKENEELKKAIAVFRSSGHSSDEMTSQLDALKRQLERQDRIILELEASNKSLMLSQKQDEPIMDATDHVGVLKDELKRHCLAIHEKVIEISQVLTTRKHDLAAPYPSASGLTVDSLSTDIPIIAPKTSLVPLIDNLLVMSGSLLQVFGIKFNERASFGNPLAEAYVAEGSQSTSDTIRSSLLQNQQFSALTAENQELKTRCIELLESLTMAQSEVARLSSLQADNDVTQISELVDMKNSQIGELRKRNEALESTTAEVQNLYNELKERYMHETAEHNTLKKLHEVTERELEETRKALAGKNTTINSLIKRMATLRAEAEGTGVPVTHQGHGSSSLTDYSLDHVFYESSLATDALSTESNQQPQSTSYTDTLVERQSKSEQDAPAVYLQTRNNEVPEVYGHASVEHQSLAKSENQHQKLTDSPLPLEAQHYHSVTTEMTPLMKAIVEGNARGVGSSLKYLREALPDGTTALMLAVQYGRQSFIKYLLEKEAKMYRSDGVTAFQLAVESGNVLAITALEDYEAPPLPDVPTDDGRYTELMQAIEENRLLDAWSLSRVQAGLRDPLGRTALMFAAQHGSVPAIRFLVDSEAQFRDHNGMSALDYAQKCFNQAARANCITILQKHIHS